MFAIFEWPSSNGKSPIDVPSSSSHRCSLDQKGDANARYIVHDLNPKNLGAPGVGVQHSNTHVNLRIIWENDEMNTVDDPFIIPL